MYFQKFQLQDAHGNAVFCKGTELRAGWPIAICLHGMGGSKESPTITALAEKLRERGIDTLAFDWPAHGESRMEQLHVEDCLAALDAAVQFAQSRSAGPLYCFATSMGGYIATLYRNGHPGCFAKTVLRSPALRLGDILRSIPPKLALRKMQKGGTYNYGFARPLELGLGFLEEADAHDAFSVPAAEPETVLILQGDQDEIVPPDDTAQYAAANRIRLEILPGADHLCRKSGDLHRILKHTLAFLGV